MNLERYTYVANEEAHYYTFYSEGPKRKIKKTVTYTQVAYGPVIYNLAFGDEDPDTGLLKDRVVSDNKDSDKVLATVASTVIDFCNRQGNHHIYIKGSTSARTRLYQMGIAGIWEEICADYLRHNPIFAADALL